MKRFQETVERVDDWQRAVCRLFEIAGRRPPHMLRHTFATDLLARGIPIFGRLRAPRCKSVRTTEAYYSHWIKGRRDRLEERLSEV